MSRLAAWKPPLESDHSGGGRRGVQKRLTTTVLTPDEIGIAGREALDGERLRDDQQAAATGMVREVVPGSWPAPWGERSSGSLEQVSLDQE
jgi:hypothetical protein